jgi:hypothetical protein
MIVTSKCAIKTCNLTWFCQLFAHLSPKFFFPDSVTKLLIWHVNSSHLRTNSINCSSIPEHKNKQHPLQANTRKNVHISGIEQVDRSGPVPSRQTFTLSNGDGTGRRRDGDIVWTSQFNHTWEHFTERRRSAAERKRGVECESALRRQLDVRDLACLPEEYRHCTIMLVRVLFKPPTPPWTSVTGNAFPTPHTTSTWPPRTFTVWQTEKRHPRSATAHTVKAGVQKWFRGQKVSFHHNGLESLIVRCNQYLKTNDYVEKLMTCVQTQTRALSPFTYKRRNLASNFTSYALYLLCFNWFCRSKLITN